MKQTYETLREWYLHDLEQPDIHHGRTFPKVRKLDIWKAIESKEGDGGSWSGNYVPSDKSHVYIWSDIHFGHTNIIQYTGRPFADVSEMNASMIANYQRVVTDNDIVIFGGDISFMNVDATNEILHRLPGYKIQIVGNHDIDRKGNLTNMHFDERHLCMIINDLTNDIQLLITHYPLDSVPPGCVNLHGHIHDKLANPWNINICVEHTNYSPISLDEVITKAKAYLT